MRRDELGTFKTNQPENSSWEPIQARYILEYTDTQKQTHPKVRFGWLVCRDKT